MKYWKYQLALLSASASVLLPFSVQAQQTHHVLERLIAQRPAKAADQARVAKTLQQRPVPLIGVTKSPEQVHFLPALMYSPR